VCPALAQKYNVPYDVCATVAFLLEGDAFDHIVPDSVYYCEKLKVICIFLTIPLNRQSLSSCVANMQFCPVLPHGAATFSSIIVSQKPTQASSSTCYTSRVTRHTRNSSLSLLSLSMLPSPMLPPLVNMNYASFLPPLWIPLTSKCPSNASLFPLSCTVPTPHSDTMPGCLLACTASSGSSAPLHRFSTVMRALEAALEPMACASVSLYSLFIYHLSYLSACFCCHALLLLMHFCPHRCL
jgi:hypothetical protein